MSRLLASIFRSHWSVKSHSILKFSLSNTPSGFCSYQILALSNPHLPQSCQWIYRATLSCLPFIFCLRQLTALTPQMGHRFSLTSAHSAQGGFCCVINMKSRIICSQSLFLGATYQGLSRSFQIYFCNPLTKFYPSQYLPFLSHTAHAFFSASIHSPSPLLHSLCTPIGPQPLIDSEMLTRLLSPTFLSNAPSLFLTYQLKLFSSLLTQLSQLIRPLPPFFLGRYILATLLLGCSSLFIVMIFLDFLSISGSSSLFHLIVPDPYLMSDTAQASH